MAASSFVPMHHTAGGVAAMLCFLLVAQQQVAGFQLPPAIMAPRVLPRPAGSCMSFGRVSVNNRMWMTSSLQTAAGEALRSDDSKNETFVAFNNNNSSMNSLDIDKVWDTLQDKIGAVSHDRIYNTELASGDVPRLFSHLHYRDNNDSTTKRIAIHAAGSTLGAAALIAGTTIGAGVLALPSATVSSGFIPSSLGLCFAWGYMTVSGLLLAELSINRIAATGRPGLGILDLYQAYLGGSDGGLSKLLPLLANVAYFFLHYAMMVAYISQGGQNLMIHMFDGGALNNVLVSQSLFAAVAAVVLFIGSNYPVWTRNVNNALVAGVVASFLGLVCIGAPTVNVAELINPIHQHPENVISGFPIMVLSLVFQNVVPTIVTQLECDRRKITQAIVGGTFLPLIMFLVWNGVILGNTYNNDNINSEIIMSSNPIAMLQSAASSSGNMELLSNLVGIFSELAIVTSLIGFVYGLTSAWTDVLKLPTSGEQYEQKWKSILFGAVFLPPLAIVLASNGNPDIFIQALDYGGAFGVSTLFLLLPPFMVWKSRYTDTERPNLATLPLMPGGKLALGSLWKASGTLIIEQGLDKLGVLSWFHDNFLK